MPVVGDKPFTPMEADVTVAKTLLGIAVFLAALSLFLFGPEQGEEALRVGGLDLDSRTATALSLIFMVFGAIVTLKALAERRFASGDRTK